MDGIIPLFKERGMTSRDCVNQLQKILHTRKIGHSGTLDPSVDGVLPICVGKATKVVEYLMESGKQYRGQLLIGQASTTEDLDGEIIEITPVNEAIDAGTVEQAMKSMTGDVEQIPPMYSAVKVNGRKLYEYARAGETVERPVRHINVSRFELTATEYDPDTKRQTVNFIVECSKGTYIRTLVVDLARKLGYAGLMSDLTRTISGGFNIEQTLTMDQIKAAVDDNSIDQLLFPIDHALQKYPQYALNDDQWHAVQNGVWLTWDEVGLTNSVIALTYNGATKALYQRNLEKEVYKPLKMFSVS